MNDEKDVYIIEVAIDSKEVYDRLMNEYDSTSMAALCLGIKRQIFKSPKPNQYPFLVRTPISSELFETFHAKELRRFIDGGYRVSIYKGN